MEGFIKEDDDESRYEQERRWNIYTNYDDAYEDNEKEELCEVHELLVCNIRRYMMIKYPFNNDEEYVAVKEDEYDDPIITREEACRAYQEIFRKIDEGWMVTRAEIDQGVGSTSGIRACALRNFDLGTMELENSQNNALAKLPMLKLGEYEMWEIRIKQYFQIQDYALWEMIVPSTTEEKICKKNDVKARSLLLMALPNEHQLTFNQYVDAQSMFAAIKARFGGNEATKRTQKALLKQQLQKLVSRLAILGVVTPPEDLNVKFLRSLPSEWDTHVVVWMNKPDFDTMGLDDLYNNFKIVEQKVKRSAGANNDDKNLAFLTTSGASSTNNINTVNPEVSTGTTKVNTASTETSTASFSDATVYAFLSTQPQGSQLVHEDLEQLHDDDLEEMDLKWNMALLSMRARKFYQRTGRKIIIDGSSTAGYDKSKVECFNCHKMGHFARECRAPRSKDNRNWNQGSSSKAVRIEDASEKAMCAIDGAGFDWSDMAEEEIQANMALMAFTDSEVSNDKSCSKSCLQNYEALKKQYDDLLVKLDDTGFKASTYKRGLSILEGQIIKYKESEVLFSEEIALLKRSVGHKEYLMGLLRTELEKVKEEKEGFEFKIAKFEKSSKDLDQLLASQITDKSKKGFGYNVVPSPHPLILNRPTSLDLSYSGLEEFKQPEVNEYGPRDSSVKPTTGCDKESDNSKENTDDSLKQQQKTDSSSVKSPLKVDKDWKEKFFCPANQVREEEPKKARENNDAPIIEDWVSDDEDDVEPISRLKRKCLSYCCPNVYKHMAPRTLLMKTGLRPVNTVRSVNTGRTWMLKAHVWKNIAHLSDFKDFDGGYVTFGGGANRGRITGKVAVKHQILLKIPRQENMEKGIKREYSVARTPQQNGVAERKNRTLIEAARTMLADSKYDNILAEAVSTACYVQNRVYKELSASSLSSNGTADQQVNTVRPDINTGSREVSTALPEVNTATPKDLGGPSPASEDSQMEDQEIVLGNIPQSYEVPTTPHTRIHKDHPVEHVIGDVQSSVQTRRMKISYSEKGFLSAIYEGKTHQDLHTCLCVCFLSQEEPKRVSQALRDLAWVEAMQEELLQFHMQKFGFLWIYLRNKQRRVAQGHTQEEGIDYDEVFAPVAKIEAIRIFLAYASYIGFMVYQMDVKSVFLYGQIEEEGHILLVQIYVDDIIFGSTKKELCDEFEKLMKDKFQMSSMGELTFFLGLQVQQNKKGIFISQDKYVHEILRKFNYSDVKSASTPTDLEKPLVQDGDAADVDEHLYRSMIGSLMYLTASRPDIMFAVCACARFQVSPKSSHLLAVKRIFRYLKGKPSLGSLDPKPTAGSMGTNVMDTAFQLLGLKYWNAQSLMPTPWSAEASIDDNGEVQITATIDGSYMDYSLRDHTKTSQVGFDQDGFLLYPLGDFEQWHLW
ncbi:retrovirus-related pol polyprotein from transposon TNT 1-94 [Tanacetum coccineum]